MALKEDLKDIKGMLIAEKQIKEKKWRFPFGKKVGRGQRIKNFVTVLLLNENGTYVFKKYKIEDQVIIHETIPRLASAGYVMFDKKGNPLLILPNWSVEPFSPLEHYDKSLINGSNTKGYKILLAKMEADKMGMKKQMGNLFKWVIGLILAGIIIYAFISGGGN